MKIVRKHLDKALKKHLSHCTIFRFRDGDKRHCSCGRDGALQELADIVALVDGHKETKPVQMSVDANK